MRNPINRLCSSVRTGICLLFIFFFSSKIYAQIDRNKKEEINITSAFKPSIVRTGKIEFRGDPPLKDTSSYVFRYSQTPFNYKTFIGPLEVKPLAFMPETENTNGESFFARIGYGNLQNPLASVTYTSKQAQKQFSVNGEHISAQGDLNDQNYSNSSVSARYRNTINLNQVVDFFVGYDFNQYGLYGYDHNIISFTPVQFRQNFHHANAGVNYQHIAGDNGQILIDPSLRFDYLATNKNKTESQLNFNMPIAFRLTSKLNIKSAIKVNTVQLNNTDDSRVAKTLIQFPLSLDFSGKDVNLIGGIIPVLKHDKFSILPEILASYSFPETGLKVKAGIHNDLNINSMYKILLVNPFVTKMDSLTIFQEQQIFAGFDLHNARGLQLSLKTGVSTFSNQALFVNAGVFGNEFNFLNESSLSALMMEANLSYVFSNTLKFSSNLLGYSFQKQNDYDEAYGLLPLELAFRFEWQPLKKLKSRFSTTLWTGTMTRAANNVDVRLQDAADISMGVEYEFNKKWALWIDLNNIANSRYQRWNQYPSFGLNFIAGVRYAFNKKDQ